MTSLHKNFGFLAASNLLSPLLSMILVLAISRTQGVEVLGKYSLMMTVFVLAQSCATFGLPVVITREVAKARQRASSYFVSACAVAAVLLVAALAPTLAALQWAMTDRELRMAIELVLAALLPSLVTAYGEAVLLAYERAAAFVVLNLFETTLRAAIGTVLVMLGHGIVSIAITLLALRVITCAAFLIALRRRGLTLPAPVDWRLCRTLLSHVPVLGSIPIVHALYARADVFLLTSLGTWTDVGLYSAALRLVDVTRSIPPAYARALYPVLSRLRGASPDEFAVVVRRSIRNILVLVIPIALLLSGLAEPVIVLLYGPSVATAAVSLRLLVWAIIPGALAALLAQVLFSMDRQAVDLRVNLFAAVVIVAAGILLIPRLGAVGAAGAVLVATSFYTTLQYVFVRQWVADLSALSQLGRLLAIAAMSSAVMGLLPGANSVLVAAAGLATYAAGLGLSGLLTWQDLTRAGFSLRGASVASH